VIEVGGDLRRAGDRLGLPQHGEQRGQPVDRGGRRHANVRDGLEEGGELLGRAGGAGRLVLRQRRQELVEPRDVAGGGGASRTDRSQELGHPRRAGGDPEPVQGLAQLGDLGDLLGIDRLGPRQGVQGLGEVPDVGGGVARELDLAEIRFATWANFSMDRMEAFEMDEFDAGHAGGERGSASCLTAAVAVFERLRKRGQIGSRACLESIFTSEAVGCPFTPQRRLSRSSTPFGRGLTGAVCSSSCALPLCLELLRDLCHELVVQALSM
jgi:hypothetical protein